MTRYTTAWHPTPLGDALLAFDGDDLVALHLEHDDRAYAIDRMARMLQSLPPHDDAVGVDLGAQLNEYFAGARREFDIRLDWRFARGFTRLALEVIAEIPYGETASYGEVAMRAGSPRASRAVGAACRTTPFSLVVPVHRVIRSDGSIGEYGAHPEVKQQLLELERSSRE